MSSELSFISERCAIVVQSCDAYEDVWDMFFSALREYWPDCDVEIILNTETKTKTFDGLCLNKSNPNVPNNIQLWGARLLNVLNSTDKEFVITLFDDFILEDIVNVTKLIKCLEWMKADPNIAAFYFCHNPEESTPSFDGFLKLGQKVDYRVNSAPALWRKDKLIEVTGEIDTPWAWEFFGSARTYDKPYEFHCAAPDKEDTFIYQYRLGGAIRRGKWVERVVVPAIEKYNISLDTNLRGFASESLSEGKYSLRWKIDFFILGFRMVGLRAMLLLLRVIKKKLLRS